MPVGKSERRDKTVDQRSGVRVAAKAPLTVRIGEDEVAAQLMNLSARGMFFSFDRRLRVGSWIELVFPLPRKILGSDGVWLRCAAQVVRVEEGLPEDKFGIAARVSSYEAFRADGSN